MVIYLNEKQIVENMEESNGHHTSSLDSIFLYSLGLFP